jgi:hypothetical protein
MNTQISQNKQVASADIIEFAETTDDEDDDFETTDDEDDDFGFY